MEGHRDAEATHVGFDTGRDAVGRFRAQRVTQVAFAGVDENVDIYSLQIDANRGKAIGTPRQLTYDLAEDFHPALSLEGSMMAFIQAGPATRKSGSRT